MSLLLFYLLVLLFIIAAVFLAIKTKVKGMFFVIPLVVFLITSGVYTYQSMLGEPTTRSLPASFFVRSFIADEQNGKIYIWVTEENRKVPVSYTIPYTKKDHQDLENGMSEVNGSKGTKALKGKWNSIDGLELGMYHFIDQPHLRKEQPNS